MTDIILNLKEHCIETACRKEFKRLMTECLRMDVIPPEIEERMTLLKAFLENTDFKGMRAGRPELSGGKDLDVILRKAPDGKVEVVIESNFLFLLF